MAFKFELWDISNGTVLTRPAKTGETDEDTGEEILKNLATFYPSGLDACKEIDAALVAVRANYQKRLNPQKR